MKALKAAILRQEEDIHDALKKDLGKSREESWGSECGLVIMEINHALQNLEEWMSPQKVRSNLANIFSSSRVYRESLGVVLIISPWNYPFQLALAPLVAAVAAGNCAVIKPSEFAPATAQVIENLVHSNFDADYLRVINGEGAVVIPEMMKSFRFDHVFYTGSTATGKKIYSLAAEQLIPVTLELGGKSPAIVYDDADLDVAIRRVVQGKFLNCGQTCIAPDYLLVRQPVYDLALSKLKQTISSFYGDRPSESGDYGKIINPHHFRRLEQLASGLSVAYGFERNAEDLFFGPTILTGVSLEHAVMKEEIFGPLLPVIPFDTTEEAMAIVYSNPDPLALYLFTRKKAVEDVWIQNVRFGGGCINNTDWQFTNPYLPFGGVGSSGIGSYHGVYGFQTFSRMKSVLKTPNWFDPRVKYPPYKGKLKLLKWLIR